MPELRRRVGGRHRPAPHPDRYVWTARVLFVLAVVLLTSAAVSFAVARPGPHPGPPNVAAAGGVAQQPRRPPPPPAPVSPPPPSPPSVSPPSSPSSGHSPQAANAPAPAPTPRAIRIPALGIAQDLVALGVVGTSLQVPGDYADIGWWQGGPAPGERGAAVMVGHVDSPTGPAVFYRLSGLKPGHRIVVRHRDGSRTRFVVRAVEVYDRAAFPSAKVYRTGGKPGLHLVTCGGSFDADAQQYTSNVVVFADLVDRVPAARQQQGWRSRLNTYTHQHVATLGGSMPDSAPLVGELPRRSRLNMPIGPTEGAAR